MAIEKDILMAVSFVPDESARHLRCELHNIVTHFMHSTFECDMTNPESIELVHRGPTRWTNYFRVVLQGLACFLPPQVLQRAKGTIKVFVSGSVPPESSLSSSAAMTTCSTIAILSSIDALKYVSRKEIAEIACKSERLVGVNSGGMDQAVSVFGKRDHAVYVSFVPELTTTPVVLPLDGQYIFLVTNTMIASDKKVHGPVQYNLRVVETRLAAAALERLLNIRADFPPHFRKTLRAVSDTLWQTRPEEWQEMLAKYPDVRNAYNDLGVNAGHLQAMLNVVENHLPRRGLTRQEVEKLVGVHGSDFEHVFLSQFPVHTTHFHLHARAFHVYSEALRVLQFRALLDRTNAERQQGIAVSADSVAKRLGRMMHASHESLRDYYECSSPELDLVVNLARQNGAVGSRLTGAGWGGCAVHLVHREKLQHLKSVLKESYYAMKFGYMRDAELDEAMFATTAGDGACVHIL